jgi:hypothetical protein
METTQEAGTAGVNGPDNGSVTLRDVLAANRALTRHLEAERPKRQHRDHMIRAALRQEVATQAELARETGLSEMQVSRIASGKTSGRTRPE